MTVKIALPAAGERIDAGRLSETLLYLFLATTIFTSYLNPILRTSPDSGITVFRLLIPVAIMLLVGKFLFQRRTLIFLLFVAILLAYSLVQIVIGGPLRDLFMFSYLANLVVLLAYIFLIETFIRRYGFERFYRHLYVWFTVMVVLSIHQLITGFEYPNVPYLAGVARIYFGQENEASIAIAAFIPFLFYIRRRILLSLVLLIAALGVLYINSTRVVLLALAFYPVFILLAWISSWLRDKHSVPHWVSMLVLILIVSITVLLLRDVPIPLHGYQGTLNELVLEPIGKILTGTQPEVFTSINVRVTLAIAGLQALASTLGFGVGPGGATHVVAEHYDRSLVISLHIFPLQLLVEHGWMLIAAIIWFFMRYRRLLYWRRYLPYLAFAVLATASGTLGMVTNYYVAACMVFALHYFRSPARDESAEASQGS